MKIPKHPNDPGNYIKTSVKVQKYPRSHNFFFFVSSKVKYIFLIIHEEGKN